MNAAATSSASVLVDASKCVSSHSRANQFARLLWGFVWVFLFRPSPRFLHGWRRLLLRLFGARIGRGSFVYPSARIWAPWNLTVGDHSSIAGDVDCYCVDRVTIGSHVAVSQYTHLCTATHDYEQAHLPLVTAPIVIEDQAWVTSGAFIAPGVRIGQGSVVGARSVVTKDVKPWSVVAGQPARFIKQRILNQTSC